MTPDYVVEYLRQKMGDDEKNCGIEWHEDNAGGYLTLINGITLRLRQVHIRTGMIIALTLSKEWKNTTIYEPQNGGLFSSRRKLQTQQGQIEERLRINLQRIWSRAEKQCASRHEAEKEETTRQELFRAVTSN